MHNRNHVFFLAAALVAVGLALFFYKYASLGMPLMPDSESEVWTVEARISMTGGAGPVKATLLIPRSPPGFGILNENFVSRGFGLNTREVDNNRVAEWARRRARGPQALYYRVALYRDESGPGNKPEMDFPTVPQLEEPYATALTQLVSDARARSADIASFAAQVLRNLSSSTPDENVALFIKDGASALDKARVAQTLLAGARIPSMIAHGIELRGEPHLASTQAWLEVFNGERWLYFNPTTGDQFEPGSRLTWFYGLGPLVDVDGARRVETELFVRREMVDSLVVAERRAEAHGSHAVEFSLFELPLRTQAVYAVLLMIPIGALIMVLMRNIIGVPTFGTFTPILIALAFRETRLLYGVILFSLVVALGLTVRFYLDRLRLLLVPRLASILTVVVIMLMVISVLSQRLDLETGLSVALFPMVILTMVIERMSIVWDERGSTEAMKEGLGSLIVAIAAYLVMSYDKLEYLLFVFPELLLVVLAITLLLGRYTGYRLTELARFAVLGRPPKAGAPKPGDAP